jgi:hypothetical protein
MIVEEVDLAVCRVGMELACGRLEPREIRVMCLQVEDFDSRYAAGRSWAQRGSACMSR